MADSRGELIAELLEAQHLHPLDEVRVERTHTRGTAWIATAGAPELVTVPIRDVFEFGALEEGEEHPGVHGFLPAPIDWPALDLLEFAGWLADELDECGIR